MTGQLTRRPDGIKDGRPHIQRLPTRAEQRPSRRHMGARRAAQRGSFTCRDGSASSSSWPSAHRTQANQLDYTTPERACSSLDPGGTAR
jgi:hypothetical protein